MPRARSADLTSLTLRMPRWNTLAASATDTSARSILLGGRDIAFSLMESARSDRGALIVAPGDVPEEDKESSNGRT